MQYLNDAIRADADYCLPLIVKACELQSANDERFNAEVAGLLDQAQERMPANAGLEHDLLKAVSAALAGQGVQAARYYEQLLLDRAAPSWSETHKDYGPLLSLRAFANEEAGFFAEAERYGRAAVEIDPSDVWGAHAVAHVMDMQGDAQKGSCQSDATPSLVALLFVSVRIR